MSSTVQEMFTEFPTVASAQLSDIVLAVQGYVSPSNLGLSVQETLGQIYNLFQSNIILYNSGNPNGILAGTTFQLCWDTLDGILWVCTASGTSSTAVWTKSVTLTAGPGISINQSGSTITISSSSATANFNVVTGTNQSMLSNNTYQANNSSLVTLTLPVSSSLGDIIRVTGFGSGGWSIVQNSGQQIIVGDLLTTLGSSGHISSTNQYDGIELVCVTANTIWQNIVGPQGNLTIV